MVSSIDWNNGPALEAGAATWADGTTGITGAVTPANSLVGDASGDHVSTGGVYALANGNYVVGSPDWDNPSPTVVANVGAATWANGTSGIVGSVTPGNSLVGTTADDRVSRELIRALPNGNYLVASQYWSNGLEQVGALTWGDGDTNGPRLVGPVTTANSLHGSSAFDNVGSRAVALTNGNYVVLSPSWDELLRMWGPRPGEMAAARGCDSWGP